MERRMNTRLRNATAGTAQVERLGVAAPPVTRQRLPKVRTTLREGEERRGEGKRREGKEKRREEKGGRGRGQGRGKRRGGGEKRGLRRGRRRRGRGWRNPRHREEGWMEGEREWEGKG